MNNPYSTWVKEKQHLPPRRSLLSLNYVTHFGTFSETEFGLLIIVFMELSVFVCTSYIISQTTRPVLLHGDYRLSSVFRSDRLVSMPYSLGPIVVLFPGPI